MQIHTYICTYVHIYVNDTMKLSINRGDRVPTRHLLSPNKDFSAEDGLYLNKFLAKGVTMGTPKLPGYCKSYW